MKRAKYSDGHQLVWSDEFHGWVTPWTRKPKREPVYACCRCDKPNSVIYEEDWCDECVEKYEEEFGPPPPSEDDEYYDRVSLRYPSGSLPGHHRHGGGR